MKADQELRNILRQIDHKGYLAYKQLKGEYHFPEYTLGSTTCRETPLPPRRR